MVTTINGFEHPGIEHLIRSASPQGYELILIGDTKTPVYPHDIYQDVSFFSIQTQESLNLRSVRVFPKGHYARKNLGYLMAARKGYEWIGESDDDNLCFETFWSSPSFPLTSVEPMTGRFLNTFAVMKIESLWPRGLPITSVRDSSHHKVTGEIAEGLIVCIQGLTDVEPDVDAIARSLYDTNVKFPHKSFTITPGFYAPINSQMTLWNSSHVLPLLYLPFTVSWRVADIWRGFIAQRYFSLMQWNTVYRGSVGRQIRNPHDLLVDFFEEIEVHTKTDQLISILETINNVDISDFLIETYTQLIENKLVSFSELEFLHAWLEDCLSCC